MPTLLTTPRMSPELRARVEASVRGRGPRSTRRVLPLALSILRVGLVVAMVVAISSLIVARKRARDDLERQRAALLSKLRSESASLNAEQKNLGVRVEGWLERCAGPFVSDTIEPALRAEGALASALARPTVYVRGPLESFAGPSGVAEAAMSSFNDAFVLCLLEPPSSRTEKALLGRARSAYGGGARVVRAAGHVARLHHALVGLPLLGAAWESRVLAASDPRELGELVRVVERAPLADAKAAAKAELLLYAMDEPGDRRKPAELDGERPHDVRVGLVDLTSKKLLFAVRRRVDPSSLSPATRAEYAASVDACALALDVRSSVSGESFTGG